MKSDLIFTVDCYFVSHFVTIIIVICIQTRLYIMPTINEHVRMFSKIAVLQKKPTDLYVVHRDYHQLDCDKLRMFKCIIIIVFYDCSNIFYIDTIVNLYNIKRYSTPQLNACVAVNVRQCCTRTTCGALSTNARISVMYSATVHSLVPSYRQWCIHKPLVDRYNVYFVLYTL